MLRKRTDEPTKTDRCSAPPPYNIDEPDAAVLNKDGHTASDLGHGGPMSGGASVPRSVAMRTRTQLEDEQPGQMRSDLTNI